MQKIPSHPFPLALPEIPVLEKQHNFAGGISPPSAEHVALMLSDSGIPARIPAASGLPTAVWRGPVLLHKFWLSDLFSSGISQLKKTKEISDLGGKEEKPSCAVLQSQNFPVWYR